MLTTLLLIPLAGALVLATMTDDTYEKFFPKHFSRDRDRKLKIALFTTLVTFIVSMVM
jgi:hypothetical protein